jgi:hypothetical protein
MRGIEHVARIWENRNACRILAGKPEEMRPLGWHRYKWKDNIKIDIRGTEALCYNSKGSGIDSQCGHCIFQLTKFFQP